MDHPHNLLQLVIKQHYRHKPEVLLAAQKILQDYSGSRITYEETLINLFQLLNGLPSDIVLYYLSTVPLPKNQEVKSTSVLPNLMKQMLNLPYHNNMRPVLLKYLNEKVPPLAPLSKSDNSGQLIDENLENKEGLRSVIDDNIKQEKNQRKKSTKAKPKIPASKNSNIKPLSLLCANNIYKNHYTYCLKYKKLKRDAWKLVNSNKCDKEELEHCYKVLKDTNKKIKWLDMIKTGKVSRAIIEEEYGQSDVFYLERHLQDTVSEDILNMSKTVLDSVNIFLNKC